MILESEIERAISAESDAGFRLIFDPNPVPMWVYDHETLAFLAVNDAAVEKYEYSREEFLSMTVEDVLPPEDLPSFREYRELTERDVSSGRNATIPCVHQTRSGRLIDIESTWHLMPFGNHLGVFVINVDRSEQKLTEDKNREQASLLDLAADAIIVRDLDHRILFWNQGAERLYGWSKEEAVGAKTTDIFVGDAATFATAFNELLGKGMWSGELQQARKDGVAVVVNSRWTLVSDGDGKPKSVLVFNTDITETKKLESQFLRAQRLESIGTLASGIAHDLNNILSPILMSVGILRRNIDPSAERMLSIIEGSAERGAGIVKQVLTFARGVEGERVLLQPKHLISELSKIMAQTFPRNIDIQTQFPPELWTVMGDATQLHQVLLNLCVNARDAMPAGGMITIGGENVEVDSHFASMNPGAQLGANVAFRVADNGSGMSAETMEKIFDPFFTTKEVGKGTGLGLATVIGIVKSHGGFLTLQSEIGVGTTFKVFIPASRDAAAASKAAPEAVARGNGELILVVDDEAAIREALVGTLEAHGYNAYTAEDGTDALALYHQRRDDIAAVITDISMGQMDGVTLVRSLRKLNPRVRVIVSSGHFTKENSTILEGLGVKTLLDKPYSADKLLRSLAGVLKGN